GPWGHHGPVSARPAPDSADDVELIGVDFNAALVAEAERLASSEDLPCRFLHGDAFALGEPATVYVSTGVLHHFRGRDLDAFFAAQSVSASGAAAFCHFDIAAPGRSAIGRSAIGARIFHRARTRDLLGRHDAVVSARRAHDDATLLRAAAHARGLTPLVYEPGERGNPFCAQVRPVIGVRPELLPDLRAALGTRSSGRLVGEPSGGRATPGNQGRATPGNQGRATPGNQGRATPGNQGRATPGGHRTPGAGAV
ncbi:class I SAM-dependent methyltransferase, partial [Streptomyces sp. NPDC055078]